MTDDDRLPFAELIAGVHALYRRDVSPFAAEAWWGACLQFDFEDVREALNRHASDPDKGSFCPLPADVVRVLQGTVGDRALLAWSKVLQAMRDIGAYASVTFDDPAIHAAIVDIGGWATLCRSEVDELPHWQRRFADSYKAARRRRDGFDFPKTLTGEHALALAGTKWEASHTPAAVLVGDQARAERVLLSGGTTRKTESGPRPLAAQLALVGKRPQP